MKKRTLEEMLVAARDGRVAWLEIKKPSARKQVNLPVELSNAMETLGEVTGLSIARMMQEAVQQYLATTARHCEGSALPSTARVSIQRGSVRLKVEQSLLHALGANILAKLIDGEIKEGNTLLERLTLRCPDDSTLDDFIVELLEKAVAN